MTTRSSPASTKDGQAVLKSDAADRCLLAGGSKTI